MVAQKNRPLAGLWNVWGLPHDIGDRVAVFGGDRHVDARHQREMERHVAFIARAEILQHVLRPLVCLGQQHAVAVAHVEFTPQSAQHLMRLGEVLVDRSFALDQVWHCVEPHAVDPEVEPEPHHVDNCSEDARIVEIQVWLMRVEAVPVVRLSHWVPGPVGFFRIDENDAGFRKLLVGIAPHVKIAQLRARLRPPRALEPRMLIRSMVDDQLGDDPDIAPVRLSYEGLEIGHLAV